MTSCTCPWRAWLSAIASQRGDAVSSRLADADEDAGGERDGEPSGRFECRQPSLGRLVGRTAMAVEVVAQRLEHHPLARADSAQPFELRLVQRAGICMGEQPGLVEHQLAHRGQVVDRRRVAVLVEPRPRDRIPVLRPLAEREQRLMTSGRRATPRDAQDLLGREVRRGQPGRRLRERAVPALVAAQHRERDEHLRRVGDAPPVSAVTHGPGPRRQLVGRRREDLGRIHGRTLLASCELPTRWRET